VPKPATKVIAIKERDTPQNDKQIYKVNLAPLIWRFVYRSEVYLFLLSLLPLWPALALLRSALDVRQRVELVSTSYAIARNALIAAVVVLIFALLVILQQFTKVVRLRALHRFLAQDNVSLSLLSVWALSDFYVLFHTTTSIEYLSAEDIDTVEEYMFGHTMAIVPFALLLPRVEESGIGELHKTTKPMDEVCLFSSPPPACLSQDLYGSNF